ncbi:MAG TPA: 50S ribosomal protein L23 [Candidatus Paceibacterota bacterium]|jgi:Ribosomal protein L23
MALLWQKGNKGTEAAKADAKADKKLAKAPKAAKKVETKEVAVKAAAKESKTDKRAAAAAGVVFPKGGPVIRPRVTEKAGLLSQNGTYTFDVRVDASAGSITKVIEDAYKVTVVAVRTSPVKAKTMFARGKYGSTAAGKKAYVSLKKGDVIEFI